MLAKLIAVSITAIWCCSNLIADDRLATDIELVAGAADERYRDYVAEYLRKGAAATGASFVPSAVAKNEINKLTRNKRVREPLARCMMRFVASTEFPDETRRYAFAKLTYFSEHDTTLAAKTKDLAEQLVQQDDKLLKRAADEFLTDIKALESVADGLPKSVRFDPASPDPAIPDPRHQTEAERLNSLRSAMSQAMALLERQEDQQFLNRFIDPFWIARYAADADITEDELLAGFFRDPKRQAEFRQQFLSTLKSTIDKTPKWLLRGRVASFIDGQNGSHSAEFWIYIDGAWRISPET